MNTSNNDNLKIKNIPKEIYLVLGIDEDEDGLDFEDFFEVTWNKNRICEGDIKYVLAQPSPDIQRAIDWCEEEVNSLKSKLDGEYNLNRIAIISQKLDTVYKCEQFLQSLTETK